MTRPTDAEVTNEIVQTHTRPFHIAQLFFQDAIANVSEGPSVSFNGSNFIGDTLEVRNVKFTEAGFQSAELTLYDYGSSAVSIVLNNQVAGRFCDLWLAYLKPDGQLANSPVLIIPGQLECREILDDRVVFDLNPRLSDTAFFPDVFVTKENGCTVLGKDGAVIYWGNDVFELTTE